MSDVRAQILLGLSGVKAMNGKEGQKIVLKVRLMTPFTFSNESSLLRNL